MKCNLVLGLAGDVMLGRLVNEQISKVSDYTYPWGDMLQLLVSTDLNIVNLETTLTTSDDIVSKMFNFKADPDKVTCLKRANVKVANLANNHILDFSIRGLVETINVLDNAGIAHVGAGKNLSKARNPAILNVKGVKIGVIGITDNEPGWKAEAAKPGINYLKISDELTPELKNEVRYLRERVDVLILTIHWGPNMRQRPNKEFRDFARNAIDVGVDIFHGHSAHIFQGIEVYKNKLILYDTGEFVDDYVIDPSLRNDLSFFYRILLQNSKLKRVMLFPVCIHNQQVNKAKGEDYRIAVDRMKSLSQEFNTKFEEVSGKLVIEPWS